MTAPPPELNGEESKLSATPADQGPSRCRRDLGDAVDDRALGGRAAEVAIEQQPELAVGRRRVGRYFDQLGFVTRHDAWQDREAETSAGRCHQSGEVVGAQREAAGAGQGRGPTLLRHVVEALVVAEGVLIVGAAGGTLPRGGERGAPDPP